MRTLVVACTCAAVALPSVAGAEARHTVEPVVLRKKPGEQEAVVARLPAGAEVTVLAVEGRWLRVRAGAAEGYLTRTTVSAELDAAPGVAAPSARWGAARKADGLDHRIAGELAGDGVAGNSASRSNRAAPRPAPRLALRADLGIGFRALGMDLTSNAEGGLTNYALDAGAAAATLDVDAAMRPGGAVFAAADARVSATDSSPGIDYPGPTAPAGKIPFRTFAADAGARLGARLGGAFDVALRAGAHYDAFLATGVDNAGRLPRERLLGATLGARVDIAPEGSPFAITARFDALVVGARRQTAGLEDGTASTARALWGGLTMRYALGRRLAVFGGYDLGRASTRWTGMSVRQPGVTRTQRIDTAQLVQIGISTGL